MRSRTLIVALTATAMLAAACSSPTVADTSTSSTTFAPLQGVGAEQNEVAEETTTTSVPTTTTTTEPPDTDSPEVETLPGDGDVVETYYVEFAGTTEPDAAVTVNDEVVEVDDEGAFSVMLASDLGDNEVIVVATDQAGNETIEHVTYRFDPPQGWIAAIGDSVMLGSKAELEKRIGEDTVDAIVSRQFLHSPDMVARLLAGEVPPQVIVVHLGTNGPATPALFDELMEVAADVPLMVFVNTRVPRKWEATTNETLADGTQRFDNTVLVDWFTPMDPHPELFAKDGFHPKQPGRVIFGELVAEAIFPNWVPLEE